jgi:type IVB pilus formation R64 PilN family outer membrane protein
MKKLLSLIVSVLTIMLMLSACTPATYHEAQDGVEQVAHHIDHVKIKQHALDQKNNRVYRHRLARRRRTPSWLNRKVSIYGQQLSFAFAANRLLRGTGRFAAFAPSVNQQKRINIAYQGTLKHALEALAAKSGYQYSISGRTLTWSAFVTRTFDISFMPGTSTYLLGKRADMLGPRSAEGVNGAVDSSQYSSLQGHLSVWNDLHKTLDELKSDDGRVVVSEATTAVTVTDHPANIKSIAHYLHRLNHSLSREVALQVQVLEINLDKGFNYGINWRLIRDYMHLKLGAEGQLGAPVKLRALGDNMLDNSAAGFIMRSVKGKWAGTDMLLNALGQQGKLSTVTRPRVVTLNNQVAEIDINTQTDYLREISQSSIVNGPTTVSLTPGTVKTGFTLFLLPKIQNNDVFLQLSSTLSNLIRIETKGASLDERGNKNEIQLPTVVQKRFNQRTVIPSGATLVLAGFKQVHNEANKATMYGTSLLGGRGAKKIDAETIVLITPTIIHG